jgi:hypothetical protein
MPYRRLCNFLPCTLRILLPRMRCWLVRTVGQTTEVICINQDVPTYFYAVQRSRLPMIIMPLDRGLSDTNTGEVNQALLYQIYEILW